MDDYKGAWFGSAELKVQVMERLLLHRQHDEIIQGNYQLLDQSNPGKYKGCAVGCTLPLLRGSGSYISVDWHQELENYYNIPAEVAYLIDSAFESVDGFHEAAEFAVASIATIAVGADLRDLAQRLEDMEVGYDNCGSEDCGEDAPCPGLCTEYIGRLNPDWVIGQFKAAPIAPGARAMILAG